jgi:hypothetical protein
MYTTDIHQAADDICIVAMWFETARLYAIAGWEERCTLPPPNTDWYSNSAGRFRDAWKAGWEKGKKQREVRVSEGREPDPLGSMLQWIPPKRSAEWLM